MNFFKYLWLAIVAIVPLSLIAQDTGDDREIAAVQQFIKSKTNIDLRYKMVDLTIGGDVRAKYKILSEDIYGRKQRGSGSTYQVDGISPATNEFEAQFNLLVDYKADRSWASVILRFKNDLGIAEDASDGLEMRRALIGYRLFDGDVNNFEIVAGRTIGYNMFDSKVQFDSRFDGLWLRYDGDFEKVGNIFLHGGPVIVNYTTSHYAWIGELGWKDIFDTGLYFEYSYIDWEKHGYCWEADATVPVGRNHDPRWQFRNSQFTLGYVLPPETIGKDVKLYGSYGFNSAARPREITNYTKANKFWYAGVLVGKLVKAGDWSVEVDYQSVDAQAIRSGDISGIGNGNVRDSKFYDATTAATARSKANYAGWSIEMAFALAENMTFGMDYEFSRAQDVTIGGKHKYTKMQMEAAYAF